MLTYAQRVSALIQDHITRPWPPTTGCADHRGFLNYATAALWMNQDTADANAQLAAVRLSHVTGSNCGSIDVSRANLWLSYLVRPYGLFGPGSRFFPNRMSASAATNLVTQMWAWAAPLYAKVRPPWDIDDSENHEAQAASFMLLSAQFFTKRTDFASRTYTDGTTPGQQYWRWHDRWSAWFDERAKRGLLVEVGSPTYLGYTIQAILNIYNFAEDPVLRKKAEMFLDLVFADFAVRQLHNVWGGAKCRSYPADSYTGATDAMTNFGQLLFGPEIPNRNNHSLALATSNYQPPAVVRSLATDAVGKGGYPVTARRPGVGPAGWDDQIWHVDPTRSVLDCAWVTPDYVLGGAMLKAGEPHVGPSNQNRWQGCTFATSPDARIYPLGASTAVDRTADAFVSVQKTNVLITRKKGYTSYPTLVYFPASLDSLVEDKGWLFAEEGGVYVAVKPLDGYIWLTTAKNKAALRDDRFVRLNSVGAPIIFEATRAGTLTFSAFIADILANPCVYSNGVLEYTSRNNNRFRFSSDSLVNDVPVNYSPANTYESPWMSSVWGTGRWTIGKPGSVSVTYDFSNPTNPVKT